MFTKRTHTCGELRREDAGNTVTLNGWVDSRRNLGGMLFVNLRDRYGITQIVFSPEHDAGLHEKAQALKSEDVISVTGVVRERPGDNRNPQMATGDVEVLSHALEILNHSELPPFEIRDDVDAFEDLRLKYRYLDLRRPRLQKNLLLRHRMYQVVHRYFDERGFIEVETPVLMKSTPEGARDYLVPSRVHPGKFYALPQSPQTYKQLLMIAGLDRYVQIVKCFRDEDLRADRQPEFTQIDLEMSFITQEDIYDLIEGLMAALFQEALGIEITTPFPRMDYYAALERYGTDKPDIRFGMPLVTLNDIVADSGFRVFTDIVEKGGRVTGICVAGGAEFSRKRLDVLTERAKSLGAGGLVWMKASDGALESPVSKFLKDGTVAALREALDCDDGDLLLIVADTDVVTASKVLGQLRVDLGEERHLYSSESHALLWVTDFPLLQWDENEKRWIAEHHPFTGPKPEDVHLLDTDPGKVRADCYDLVWNGTEIGSGSIRIHDSKLQQKIFSLLGLTNKEIEQKFGFLINAFQYGAPPHGGIALGFDRMVTLMSGLTSIRDVIAFPKTNSALSLMDGAPSEISPRQLRELHLKLDLDR
ncbi:MAG: aspartate--tRNA ligase [Chlorobi bacterium]|nr:aspartate--tRNA ligase [Chlorobiota bacterium]